MDSLDLARQSLARAQQRSGVRVRSLSTLAELDEARHIFDTTWPMTDGGSNLPSNLFKALIHAGGYACAAYVGEMPVGATVAVVGREPDRDGRLVTLLHSHMAAVRADFRNRAIGTAMKSHQRLWALENDIPVVSWTFDPLVRRNARLNLLKLGAHVRGYERNFYGRMDDDYDFVDESDRVFAWWEVASPRADAAAQGRLHAVNADEVARRDVRIVEIPDDIVAIRAVDVAEGQWWRHRVREQMESALADGFVVTNLTQDGNYVMERAAQ